MPSEQLPYYVTAPTGLFTAAGTWYRTSEQALKTYAAPLLEHLSLTEILQAADRWLRSPETLVLWALPILLYVFPVSLALLIALGLYVLWGLLLPLTVSWWLHRFFSWLEKPLLQVAYYALVLGNMAREGEMLAVTTGIALFIAIRWQLWHRAGYPLLQRIWSALYTVPVPDRVLKMFILRAALHFRVDLPELVEIEEDVIKHLSK